MTKNIRKTLRFSEDEIAEIEKKASENNLDFSTYARNQILNNKLKIKVEQTVNLDLIYQLNKIGINLNQIAKAVNQKDKILVLTELIEIEKELKRLEK